MDNCLKISYLVLYVSVFKIVPGLGMSWDVSDPLILLVEKMCFLLIALYMFRNDLFLKIKLLNLKLVLIFSVTLIFLILGVHVIGLYLLGIEIGIQQYVISPLLIIGACIVSPFVEEMIYRYCFFLSRNHYIKLCQVLLSSFLFAYSHATGLNYPIILLVPPFIMGLYCSYMLLIKQNIWYSIISHASFNILVLLLSVV